MSAPNQSNLTLAGESFALVGERERIATCADCGQRRFLRSGLCEPCADALEIALADAEARQSDFFGKVAV